MKNVGKEHDGTYGSGRFCSCKCARSRNHSKETKQAISNTLLKRRLTVKFKTDFSTRYCKLCNKQLGFSNKSGYCFKCNIIQSNKSIEKRNKISKTIREKVKNGTHKGWKSRNIRSYAELFWINVLDNNKIKYNSEKHVGKYFLDFVIDNIDLEIDGKQHKYEDRHKSDLIRDTYLRKQGYFVYRVSWNEINSEEGKQMMKDKIELFLDFYEWWKQL